MPSDISDFVRHDAKTAADPASAQFRLDHSPFYNLAQVGSIYESRMQTSLKAIGMDLSSWRVLMLLQEKQPCTISEIAQRATTKLSTMTKVTQRLERDSLVRLVRSTKDARSTDVFLTELGNETGAKIRAVASRIYNQATHGFENHEIEMLNRLLHRLFDALR